MFPLKLTDGVRFFSLVLVICLAQGINRGDRKPFDKMLVVCWTGWSVVVALSRGISGDIGVILLIYVSFSHPLPLTLSLEFSGEIL